jgi:DNA-binding transcriptional MerR regulator
MTIAEVSKKYELSEDTLRYYERIGMIPPVNRTPSGLRNYTEEDCNWVGLAKCMRSAGLPVEVMIEYLRLTREGDATIPARRQLLLRQREKLLEQKAAIESTLDRLNFKISRYERAMETGVLTWDCDGVQEP